MDRNGTEFADSRQILRGASCPGSVDVNEPATHAEAEAVAKAQREASVPDLLKKVTDLIHRRRKTIAKNILDIGEQIASIAPLLPRSHLRALLVSELGIDRADVATYLKLTETMGTQRDVLQEAGASFSVMKALVAVPETVGNDAVARMAQGNFIHSSEVGSMRRRYAEALDPALAEERRHEKALRSAAQSKAKSDLSAFREEFLPFVQSLIDLFNEGIEGTVNADDFGHRRVDLTATAERCLTQFEALFDTSLLPPAWDGYIAEKQPDAARFSRAHDSLISLATGAWKAVDLESGVPYDREENLLDRSIIESLIWLFEGKCSGNNQLRRPVGSLPAAVKAVKPAGRLRSLEICAGAGGQALGLHAAGFDSIGTFERNKDAVASLKANGLFGTVHNSDITTVDFRPYRGQVDLVAGGVPCQPHSRAGSQKGKADDRDLFLEAVRIVEEVRPRAFFFENVSGFGDKPAAAYRAELHDKFSALGYDNRIYSFSGKDLGLAQLRPRIAFIGFRNLPIAQFQMPPAFPQWETALGEAIYDLVAANGWPGARHWAKNVATKQAYTIVGASEKSGRQGFCSKSRQEDWAKLGIDWVELGDAAPGPDHPFDAKFRLTLGMGARLQGFPDDWVFHGSARSRRRQIANALPPIMARAVGLAIHGILTGTEYDYEKALRLPLPASRRGRLLLSSLPSYDWMDEPELLDG
ncbi:DNA (cytosine-5)-methyltransferase 1 [Aminobacter sp. J15]|nr:DNA (cytosine-5)-methyltransferase 1 [Aminobacter sp. J15]